MTEVKSFTHNPFGTNSFVCHNNSEAVIVDASCSTDREEQEILDYIHSNQLTVKHLLLTHAHIDHVFGCIRLSNQFNLGWKAHPDCAILLKHAPQQAMLYGLRLKPLSIDIQYLTIQDVITFGDATWQILYTPGHAPGSLCFVDEASQFIIAGDVLFHRSIGRTDLPGGDLGVLMESIFQQLLTLPDNMTVYSGHGPITNIGDERRHNPFLQ
ncbi:MAG: MBL fold metallo-hydrolase [Bacteroidetes bacterium]|nr:MBL fold metallo-hydrolase [Bacteroidota bacterium]